MKYHFITTNTEQNLNSKIQSMLGNNVSSTLIPNFPLLVDNHSLKILPRGPDINKILQFENLYFKCLLKTLDICFKNNDNVFIMIGGLVDKLNDIDLIQHITFYTKKEKHFVNLATNEILFLDKDKVNCLTFLTMIKIDNKNVVGFINSNVLSPYFTPKKLSDLLTVSFVNIESIISNTIFVKDIFELQIHSPILLKNIKINTNLKYNFNNNFLIVEPNNGYINIEINNDFFKTFCPINHQYNIIKL
jgi:hypothetical protein